MTTQIKKINAWFATQVDRDFETVEVDEEKPRLYI